MKYLLRSITDYAAPWIDAGRLHRGTVHSVYKGAVNLTVGRRLFALQPADSPVSPLTLRCDFPLSALDAAPGAPFTIGRGTIRTKNAVLTLTDTPDVIPTRLAPEADTDPAAYRKSGDAAYKVLAEVYLSRARGTLGRCISQLYGFQPLFGGTGHASTLFLSAAKDILSRAEGAFSDADYPRFAAALKGLIGLGSGLTPSGDDFICGVFAAFRGAGAWYHPAMPDLLHQLTHIENRTHPLSAAFITCAAEGYFSQAILNFFNRDQSVFNYLTTVKEFRKIGHSSGIDSLCGMAFALNCLCQASCKPEINGLNLK